MLIDLLWTQSLLFSYQQACWSQVRSFWGGLLLYVSSDELSLSFLCACMTGCKFHGGRSRRARTGSKKTKALAVAPTHQHRRQTQIQVIRAVKTQLRDLKFFTCILNAFMYALRCWVATFACTGLFIQSSKSSSGPWLWWWCLTP